MFSNLAKLAARSLCELPRSCQECLVKARDMERAGLLKFPADVLESPRVGNTREQGHAAARACTEAERLKPTGGKAVSRKPSRLGAAVHTFFRPQDLNVPTPYTSGGITQYDDLPVEEAVIRAWVEDGPRPEWQHQKRHQVRAAMPLLGRALDRAAALIADDDLEPDPKQFSFSRMIEIGDEQEIPERKEQMELSSTEAGDSEDTGYMPSALELSGLWVEHRRKKFGISAQEARSEFRRWRDFVKAQAWDEALGEAAEQGTIQIPDNPYREQP